jgi:hypothetical protein
MKNETKIKKWGIKEWKAEAWKWFSIWVRLFYSDKDGYVKCYTCGKRMFWKGEDAQAGHFNQGRSSAVLLHEKEVRPQCYSCNCCRYGEQHEFGERLRKEVGEKEFQEIKKQKHKTIKYGKKDWINFASHYQCEAVKLSNEKCLII